MGFGERFWGSRESHENNNEVQEETTEWENIEEEKPEPVSEYIEVEGLRLVNTEAIDIASEEGKCEWLESLTTNSIALLTERLRQAQEEDDEDEIEKNQYYLQQVQRKQLIIDNNSDFLMSDGGVMDNLWRLCNQYGQEALDAYQRRDKGANVSDKFIDQVNEDASLTHELCTILRQEIIRRNPEEYVDVRRMETTLENQYWQAERSEKTEDTEWELEQIKKEQEVLQMVAERFQEGLFEGVEVPKMPQKVTFANCVDEFVREKSEEINQLIEDSHQLVPESKALKANAAERRELAQQRSAANRLKGKFCV